MKRIRVTVTLDQDGVSPDSIKAANDYLTDTIFATAELQRLAVDWNSWRSRAIHRRSGELELVQWAKVLS